MKRRTVVENDPCSDCGCHWRFDDMEVLECVMCNKTYPGVSFERHPLIRALGVAVNALEYDTGRTINPDNAMDMCYRQSLVLSDALKEIRHILRDET